MSTYQKRTAVVVLLLSSCIALAVFAAPAVVIRRHVMAAGGRDHVGGSIRLSGTVGQTVVATATEGGGRIKVRSGFWQPSHGVSGVGQEIELPLRGPGLQENVPNPFNPMTTIHFEAGPQAGPALLRVYDVSGRLVRTLIDSEVPAGPGKVVWQGRDNQGKAVASGLFFVTLEVAGQRFTQKMVLVR